MSEKTGQLTIEPIFTAEFDNPHDMELLVELFHRDKIEAAAELGDAGWALQRKAAAEARQKQHARAERLEIVRKSSSPQELKPFEKRLSRKQLDVIHYDIQFNTITDPAEIVARYEVSALYADMIFDGRIE